MAIETEEKPNNEVDPAAIEKVENKIEEVKEEIEETPQEDKDKEWRENLTSTLVTLTEEIKGLKENKGASAELAALQQSVNRLATVVESYTPPKILPEEPPKPEVKEEDHSSPETSSETLSETVPLKEPEAPKPKERKNQRAWL